MGFANAQSEEADLIAETDLPIQGHILKPIDNVLSFKVAMFS